MSSSPVCTCCVCPAHGPAGHGADQPGGGAGWAGPARRYLESVVAWLDGPEAMGAGHGELEARLQVHSREQYRLLLQGHLDERARLEKRRSGVTGSDGVLRPRVENGHRRGLTTVFGPVTVTRKAYRAVPGILPPTLLPPTPLPTPERPVRAPRARCPGPAAETDAGGHRHDNGHDNGAGAATRPAPQAPVSVPPARNLYPADAVLNLPAGRHSAGLARLAAVEAARGSFADAREAIERATGVGWASGRSKAWPAAAAVDIEAFYAARRPEPCPGRVPGPASRRQGHRDAPGQSAPRYRRAGSPGVRRSWPPGSPPGRNTAASGWPRSSRSTTWTPNPAQPPTSSPPAATHRRTRSRTSRPAGRPGRDGQMAGRQPHRRHPRRHRGHVRRGRTP